MKKVLCLSLLTFSIFSMQLDIIKSNCSKIKNIHHKLVKQQSTKQHCATSRTYSPKLDDKKQPIKSSLFFAHKGLGSVELYHNNNGFHVSHNDKMHYVQPCFTDSIVRNVTPQQMKDFQRAAKGYLYIKQMGDGQFSLEVMDRVKGGGPGFGIFMYWTTKVLCYSIGVVGLGASVATAAPAVVTAAGVIAGGTGTATATAGAATLMAGGVAEMAIVGAASTAGAITTIAAAPVAGAVGAVIGSTAGVTAIAAGTCSTAAAATTLTSLAVTGASLGGATVGGIALTEAAALTTTVVVTQATATAGAVGGAGLIVGGIEALAAAVGTFCGMLPTP